MKHSRSFRPLSVFYGLFLLVLLGGSERVVAAEPNTPDIFSVQNVHVDVIEKSAAAAQNKALLLAQQLALKQLFTLVVDLADLERLPEISVEDAQNYVIAVSVDKERASRVRYIADMTIELNKNMVKAYLARHNVSYSAHAQTPPLLIPILRQQDKMYLWERENDWLSTLQNLPSTTVSGRFITPKADAKDGTLLSSEAVGKDDLDALQDLAVKYGSKVVIVAIAALEEKSEGLELSVALNRSRGKQLYEPELFSVSTQGLPDPTDKKALYAKAIPQLLAALQIPPRKMESVISDADASPPETEKTDGATLVTDPASDAVDTPVNTRKTLTIPLASMQDWVRIRKRLERTDGVTTVQVLSLQPQQATVRIGYEGLPTELNRLVAQYSDGAPAAKPAAPQQNATPKRSKPLERVTNPSLMDLRPTPEPNVFFEQ